jgi:CDGSH-type Zn-finger protein/uncharacterized Fe-S cluster protein YjdI
MQKKIHTYEGNEITVTWDAKRCIHAGECVRGLSEVFNTSNKPWIQPDNSTADKVADIIEKCPTGALHYTFKNEQREETPQSKNRLVLRPNGPVYFFGDLQVEDADGNILIEDTRFALCRCGASGNKPACDNSHQKISWKADINADTEKMPADDRNEQGKLRIRLMKDGPVLLDGTYTMESSAIGSHTSSKGIALCRCGGSSTKPFCDGTHKNNGFTSD